MDEKKLNEVKLELAEVPFAKILNMNNINNAIPLKKEEIKKEDPTYLLLESVKRISGYRDYPLLPQIREEIILPTTEEVELDKSLIDKLFNDSLSDFADIFQFSNGDINKYIIPLVTEFRNKMINVVGVTTGKNRLEIIDIWNGINSGEDTCVAKVKSGPSKGKRCGMRVNDGGRLCGRHIIKKIDPLKTCRAIIKSGAKIGMKCQEKISPNSDRYCHRHIRCN